MKRARTFSDLHTLSRNEKLSLISRIEHGEASREELKAASDLLSQCLLPRPRGRPKLETKSDTDFAIRAIELGCIGIIKQQSRNGRNYNSNDVKREGIKQIATEKNITDKEARRKFVASMKLLLPRAIETADLIDSSLSEFRRVGIEKDIKTFLSEKLPDHPIHVLVALVFYQSVRGMTVDNAQ